MSRTLSILGIAITFVYLGILWFIFDGRLTEILLMPPNEIGDLLAGMFGPLAILWLILGFFQQGIELRQNTRALELQAEELKHSVEQQRELVDVSKKQFESHNEFERQEKERRKAENQPKFVFHVGRTLLDGDKLLARMTIKNVGATATNVDFLCGADLKDVRLQNMTTFEAGKEIDFSWSCDTADPSRDLWLAIKFTDLHGLSGRDVFEFFPGGRDGLFNGIVVRLFSTKANIRFE